MHETTAKRGMGWIPDYPDIRDYRVDSDEVSPRLKELGQTESVKKMLESATAARTERVKIAETVDLREWFSPVEDQGELGSCTANAGAGLVEYFEKRAFNKHVDASRLFLYKATRNLMRLTGDTGASIRMTMGALVLFGVPPEEYLPYDIRGFDDEPSAFLYSFGQNYQAMSYYRLDPPNTTGAELLALVKKELSAGLPAMFGFSVYDSYAQAASDGKIPFPTPGEKIVGGHAVVAAGYDDKMKIANKNPGGKTCTGALLIRNSWGLDWGDAGYGWLPYEYLLRGLAIDWWSLLKNEWIDTGNFGDD